MQYVVYRHGANEQNQSGREIAPVALVRAETAGAAVRTVRYGAPGPDVPRYLEGDERVAIFLNQFLSAQPVEEAPEEDVREVEARLTRHWVNENED